MKKILLSILFLTASLAYGQVEQVIPAKPQPARLLNDITPGRHFLTAAQAEALEAKLVSYDDSTSTQISIVIVESLQNYTANEYATALGRKWGVGSKEFNNGIVILVSTGGGAGNRDAYIATGYGLEGAIPDVTADDIVENVMIPAFREGNYYQGLDDAVDALIKAAAGEYHTARKKKAKTNYKTVVFIILMLLSYFISRGGRGGSMLSRSGPGGWIGGPWYGGGFGSGGGFGGGSSGGGFGGFGGGGFGGGGAGGRW